MQRRRAPPLTNGTRLERITSESAESQCTQLFTARCRCGGAGAYNICAARRTA